MRPLASGKRLRRPNGAPASDRRAKIGHQDKSLKAQEIQPSTRIDLAELDRPRSKPSCSNAVTNRSARDSSSRGFIAAASPTSTR